MSAVLGGYALPKTCPSLTDSGPSGLRPGDCHMRTRLTALATPLLLLAGCTDQPSSPVATAVAAPPTLSVGGAPKFWETGATVAWNELSDRLLARRASNAQRVDVYLALAQLRAAQAAEASTKAHPPVSAAIGGA